MKNIEKQRYVRMAPISRYVDYRDLGWDHDYMEDVYREVQKMTLDDVVAFQQKHIANRKYRYLILGNENELDMQFLESLGKVKKLTIKDIFVY